MKLIDEFFRIAYIHVSRIESAVKNTRHLLPLTADKAKILLALDVSIENQNNILCLEMLINRFGKLQDLIGAKIITACLAAVMENVDNLSLLDKLHKLEKLGVVPNVQVWQQMRTIRNNLAHEYPENPALMAESINAIFALIPALFAILDNLKAMVQKATDGS